MGLAKFRAKLSLAKFRAKLSLAKFRAKLSLAKFRAKLSLAKFRAKLFIGVPVGAVHYPLPGQEKRCTNFTNIRVHMM